MRSPLKKIGHTFKNVSSSAARERKKRAVIAALPILAAL